MNGDLRKVRRGDPLRISASAFNAFIDAARYASDRQNDVDPSASPAPRRCDVVRVKNESGGLRGRYDVLGLAGPVIKPTEHPTEFDTRVVLRGTTPTAQHRGRFVVLLEPLRPDAIGRAVLVGLTQGRVKVVDERHRYADVDDESPERLKSAGWGAAELVWLQPPAERAEPEIAVCLVRLGPAPPRPRVAVVRGCQRTATGITYLKVRMLLASPHTFDESGEELALVWASYDPMTLFDTHVLVCPIEPVLHEDGATLIEYAALPFLAWDPALLDEPAADCIAAYINPCVNPQTPQACELISP